MAGEERPQPNPAVSTSGVTWEGPSAGGWAWESPVESRGGGCLEVPGGEEVGVSR